MSEAEHAKQIALLQRRADRDRAARKEAERLLEEKSLELYTAKIAAETANRMKSEFLANVSHELRTPLHAIIGLTDIIRNQMLGPLGDPQYLDYAIDIQNSGQQLLSVVNDLLDLARIEAGRMQLNEHDTDLEEMLTRCIEMAMPQAEKSEIDLRLSVPQGLPIAWADEKRLQQVVLNLLTNSLKFTGKGGTVEVRVASASDGSISIAVIDTGIGIEREHLDRVLQPFVQVDGGRARQHEGAGLGLALCRSLVDLHDGSLGIDSEVGQGTTVTIVIPAGRIMPCAA